MTSRILRWFLFAMLGVFGSWSRAEAAVINVPKDFTTIQAAINAAANGDTVQVAPGTYNENLNFGGKAITVTSTGGAAVTFIDGGQKGPVVIFDSGETAASVLSGFTIRNGASTSGVAPAFFDGGGIFISGASPSITGNTITQNTAGAGGGIAVESSSAIVQGNTITNNTLTGSAGIGGAGILVSGSGSAQILGNTISNNDGGTSTGGAGIAISGTGNVSITGNMISGNTIQTLGGGIALTGDESAVIIQNVIAGNFAAGGAGGIYCSVPSTSPGPYLLNNTIAANTVGTGTTLPSGVFFTGFESQIKVTNNVIVGASPALFCDGTSSPTPPSFDANDVFSPSGAPDGGVCTGLTGTGGNISADPLFFDAAANFHLQFGSPAIDKGDSAAPNLPSADFDGNPRIVNSVVDMGVYEFFPTTMSLSATSFTFSSTSIGATSASQMLTVTNTGTSSLLLDITITGDFAQTNNCGAMVAPAASCDISVTFSPTAQGSQSGAVTITSNTATSPSVISLSGSVAAAILAASASSLDFGSQLVLTTSAPQTVTLTNTGNLSLSFTSISTTGPFGQANTCASPLAVGGTCTVTVTFTPTAAGTSVGALTLVDNAPGSPQSITLTGTGFIYSTPQINAPLVPSVVAPGSAAFTLTVNGSGFASVSVVNWNGTPRTTTFVSPMQLTAAINAADVAAAGTAMVTVMNPTPGGGTSNAVAFQITGGTFDPTFSRTDYGVGKVPVGVAAGDFNGDGRPDLALVNEADNTLSILVATPTGTLQVQVVYPTGVNPGAIAVGDFNKDGKLDLAVANYGCPLGGGTCTGGSVSIFLGNGDGSFQPQAVLNTNAETNGIAAGDFNSDGKLDLAVGQVGTTGGQVAIYLGNGDGTFQAGAAYLLAPANPQAPQALVVGDFNRDGKLDIATANGVNSNNISIFLGNGDGTFQPAVGFATGAGPYAIVAGDFNGDNRLDLATANSLSGTNTVSVLLGNGDGTFQSSVDYTTGVGPNGLTTTDLNGDGKLDLVTTNGSAGSVSVLLGNGDGTFQTNQDTAVGVVPAGVAAGDFDGDGRVDLATANSGANSATVLLQAPGISLSASTLTFTGTGVGVTTAAQTVTLTNSGSTPLSITSITVTGDFAQTNTCGISLAAGANCMISVTFTPTATGTRTGTLTITDNAAGSPQTVTLTGNATAPTVSLTASMTFGSQNVGTTSAAQTVTMTNTGGADLTITSLAASGDFAQTNNCAGTLTAGTSCAISVTFTPSAVGARTGAIMITDNAVGSPQTIALSGTGVAPAMTLSAANVNFGSQTVGASSASQTIVLSNSGSGTLAITSIAISGANAGDFAQTNSCGANVAPQTNCAISVVFTPTATGARAGVLTFIDNAAGSPQAVNLAGTGADPAETFSANSVNFAGQVIGASSAAQVVTLTNSGNASLTITSVASTGDFAETNNCVGTLPMGAKCTMNVMFKPTTSGSRTGALTISDNAPGSPHAVPLSGMGEDYSIFVGPLPSQKVIAGATAKFNLNIYPDGGFTGTVSLTCTGAPPQGGCLANPTSVKLTGSGVQIATLSVTTTGSSLASPRNFGSHPRERGGWPLQLWWLVFLAAALAVAAIYDRRKGLPAGAERGSAVYRRAVWKLAQVWALAAILLLALTWAACGGGSSSPVVHSSGTPTGTYNLTLTATYTSGSTTLTHTVPLKLTVD